MGSVPGLVSSPGRRKWQPTQIFLPGKFRGQRNLVGYNPRCHESRTRLTKQQANKQKKQVA